MCIEGTKLVEYHQGGWTVITVDDYINGLHGEPGAYVHERLGKILKPIYGKVMYTVLIQLNGKNIGVIGRIGNDNTSFIAWGIQNNEMLKFVKYDENQPWEPQSRVIICETPNQLTQELQQSANYDNYVFKPLIIKMH